MKFKILSFLFLLLSISSYSQKKVYLKVTDKHNYIHTGYDPMVMQYKGDIKNPDIEELFSFKNCDTVYNEKWINQKLYVFTDKSRENLEIHAGTNFTLNFTLGKIDFYKGEYFTNYLTSLDNCEYILYSDGDSLREDNKNILINVLYSKCSGSFIHYTSKKEDIPKELIIVPFRK